MVRKREGWAAIAAITIGVMLCVAAPSAAQMMQPKTPPPPTPQPGMPSPQAGQQQPQQQQGATQSTPADKPPANKEEDDAYMAIRALSNQQNTEVIAQSEEFLSKYPTSRYRPSVYFRLVNSYMNTSQPAKVVTTGEKAIAEDPDNVDVLALVSTVIPRTVDPQSLDADRKLSEAEKYARHAIEVTNNLTKPEGASEEQFAAGKNERLGLAHYGLGLVDFRRQNTSGMVEELELASKLDPTPEPLLFYLLGTGDLRMKKFPEAEAAFDRCAKAQWDAQWQSRCQQGVQQAKQAAAPPAHP